jgi:hypothetical protein
MRCVKFFALSLGVAALCGLLAFAVLGQEKKPDLNSVSETDLKVATIRFERTRCYGNCPAYTVTIHGDGRVAYSGEDHVKTKGPQEGRIGLEAFKTLVLQFATANFLSIDEQQYSHKCSCSRQCTDMPSAITEITVSDVTHRVNHYYGCGCAPKALFDLERAIDKAVNVEQWTGDVSKQGPFGTTCWDSRAPSK